MRSIFFSLLVVCLASSARADSTTDPKLALDHWDAAYVQGVRAGYVHTFVHEIEKDQTKLLRATMELRLTIKRSGQTAQLGMDSGTYETLDGKVVGVFLKHFLGKSKTLEITGNVDGRWLRLTQDKTKAIKPAPWNPDVVGLAGQQRLWQDRNLTPGYQFGYLTFEPSINLVIKTTVTAKDYEDVEVFGKQKRRLLRVESRPEKVENIQLPTLVSWIGADFTPLRNEADIPPFGRVTLLRTTKEVALSASGSSAQVPDIGTSQYVKLTKRIAHPYETSSAHYRITIRDEKDPATIFAQGARQDVKTVRGNVIELKVTANGAAKGNAPGAGLPTPPPHEYSQSSYFINSADSRVKTLAHQAIKGEREPLRKARSIEQWVHEHMTVTSDEVLAPADHVARTLRGDCTEFAMLTAAMCRAEGIPSRTAVGLIYADVRSGPVFAFHMWTEVWVEGAWQPLDATLGKGYVGATHLKIRDQSWHDTFDQSPLLPVFNVLGRLSIEVLRTTPK